MMMSGVKIPKPATMNHNRIVSSPVTLLKYGIKKLVCTNISNAAVM
jgi:hypothetical protein